MYELDRRYTQDKLDRLITATKPDSVVKLSNGKDFQWESAQLRQTVRRIVQIMSRVISEYNDAVARIASVYGNWIDSPRPDDPNRENLILWATRRVNSQHMLSAATDLRIIEELGNEKTREFDQLLNLLIVATPDELFNDVFPEEKGQK